MEQQFSALEIFELLHDKLVNREKVDTYHQSGEKPVREVHTQPPSKPKPSESGKGSGSPKQASSVPTYAPPPAPPSTFLAGFDQPTGNGGNGGGPQHANTNVGGYNAWWGNGRGKGGKGEGGKGKGEKGKGKGGRGTYIPIW